MKPGNLLTEAARKLSTTLSGISSQPAPSREQIAVRAYEIFLKRGGEHGHDFDDWLQAEKELSHAGGGRRGPGKPKDSDSWPRTMHLAGMSPSVR